jgi:hypothetical protein
MAKRLMLAISVCFAITSVMAKSKSESVDAIRVKQFGAVLYKAELSEPGDTAGTMPAGAEVQMLKQSKARSLIKLGNLKGWADNSVLERIKGGSSTRTLKDIEVQGWLDNPAAVYILDNANPDANNLPLDRSFASDILEKKDREDVERTYDENK